MDVQNVISELTHIFDVVSPIINERCIMRYGVSREEYDRMYKLVYKITHDPDSGCVVVSSKVGDDPEREVYRITPELKVVDEDGNIDSYHELIDNYTDLVIRTNRIIVSKLFLD